MKFDMKFDLPVLSAIAVLSALNLEMLPVPAVKAAPGSVLVAQGSRLICGQNGDIRVRYDTANYQVFICKMNNGSLRYVGVEKGNASQNVILPARQEEDVYLAVNGDVTYTVNNVELVVYQRKKIIGQEAVQRVVRY